MTRPTPQECDVLIGRLDVESDVRMFGTPHPDSLRLDYPDCVPSWAEILAACGLFGGSRAQARKAGWVSEPDYGMSDEIVGKLRTRVFVFRPAPAYDYPGPLARTIYNVCPQNMPTLNLAPAGARRDP